MSKRLLGCDVDGVIVDTLNLYKEASKHLEDPLDFWRSEDLYDNLVPMDGSVEKLKQLSTYFDIVFVSRLKGRHHRSKFYFCKRYFPFMTEFVGTHGKWVLNSGLVAMIDDLPENLAGFDPNKRILFGSEQYKDWNSFDVAKFCREYL